MDECYCDYDPPLVYRKTEVARARAVHECYDCSRAILPGESYERVWAIYERGGPPQVMLTCAWCIDLRDWLTANVPCYCYMHGGLFESAEDTVDNYAHETIGLRFGYLRRKAILQRRPSVLEVLAQFHSTEGK